MSDGIIATVFGETPNINFLTRDVDNLNLHIQQTRMPQTSRTSFEPRHTHTQAKIICT